MNLYIDYSESTYRLFQHNSYLIIIFSQPKPRNKFKQAKQKFESIKQHLKTSVKNFFNKTNNIFGSYITIE